MKDQTVGLHQSYHDLAQKCNRSTMISHVPFSYDTWMVTLPANARHNAEHILIK